MNKFFKIFSAIFIIFAGLNAFCEEKDDFVNEYFADKEIQKPAVNSDYNYESLEKIPIHLEINKKISTNKKSQIYDGEKLYFTVKRNVKYDNKIIIKAGTPVEAVLETYSSKGMNGVPAILVAGKFKIPGIDEQLLDFEYVKKGVSLTIMVLPIKWALTPIPFVGSTTNLILGCNAAITPGDNFDIFYYPNGKKYTEEVKKETKSDIQKPVKKAGKKSTARKR